MRGRNASIAVLVLSILLVGSLAYFLFQPITQNVTLGLDLQGGLHVVLQAKESEGGGVNDDTINKAISILRTRVDALQVTEPVLYAEGSDRIVVEIAGVDDPEAAVDILKSTAQLEFMDEEGKVWVTGANLIDAQAVIASDGSQNADGSANYWVSLEFDSEGAELFYQATEANLNKPLYIVIDNIAISNPTVESVISGGSAVIQGRYTAAEANNLAIQLRSGALPVSLEILQSNLVGPTLGSDSLERSIKASLLGLLGVLIFMLGYYRLPGLIADISLVLYAVLLMGTMVLIGATLTLPGIAGIALSVGMAVDAHIIIFERLKDELRLGKTLKASIESGFQRAFLTILDANVTTLIAAAVLMYFGSGPVKGFAVTLSIGIVASMLTALIFTRFLLTRTADITASKKLYGM